MQPEPWRTDLHEYKCIQVPGRRLWKNVLHNVNLFGLIPFQKEVHYQPVCLSVYIFRMFTSSFLHRLLACDYFWHIYSSLHLNDQIFMRLRETELKRGQFSDTWSVEVFCWFLWHMTLDKQAESDRITLIQTSARLPSAFSHALPSRKHSSPVLQSSTIK